MLNNTAPTDLKLAPGHYASIDSCLLVKVGFIESAQSALLPENLSTGFRGSLYYRGPEGSPVAE